MSGTGDDGDSITVTITDSASGTVSQTTTVSGGVWSVSIDATTLQDGTVTYSVTETDAVGNTTTPATQTATKNTLI